MYQLQHVGQLIGSLRALVSRRRVPPRVSRTVVLLVITSLFTDLSSEMVVAVLPRLYLADARSPAVVR